MPLVFRAMKKDNDGLPTIKQSASGLGVRPGMDIDLDAQGNVIVNGKGMSVSPTWRVMSILRIPKRLRNIVPGARGSNNHVLFQNGNGPFQQGIFAAGLELDLIPPHMDVSPLLSLCRSPSMKATWQPLAPTGKSMRTDDGTPTVGNEPNYVRWFAASANFIGLHCLEEMSLRNPLRSVTQRTKPHGRHCPRQNESEPVVFLKTYTRLASRPRSVR